MIYRRKNLSTKSWT